MCKPEIDAEHGSGSGSTAGPVSTTNEAKYRPAASLITVTAGRLGRQVA